MMNETSVDGPSSWRQPLVHPACLRLVLKLPQFLPLLHSSENNAVVKSVGLTLPELYEVRLYKVTAPVDERQKNRNSKVWTTRVVRADSVLY